MEIQRRQSARSGLGGVGHLRADKAPTGRGESEFLEQIFHNLLLNFTWWVNREDPTGVTFSRAAFSASTISASSTAHPLPDGGLSTKGTARPGSRFSLNLMRIALELSLRDHAYEDIATKFFEHFLFIAEAIEPGGMSDTELWDDEDQFFYDVLRTPGEPALSSHPLARRPVPLLAVEVLHQDFAENLPKFVRHGLVRLAAPRTRQSRRQLARAERRGVSASVASAPPPAPLRADANARRDRIPFGFRHPFVSKYHEKHPYVFEHGGQVFSVEYNPGEGATRIYGGNSNWRGPVWMPINYLIVEALHKLHKFYGDDFTIECPTGSGTMMTLEGVAQELTRRLRGLFARTPTGDAPISAIPRSVAGPKLRERAALLRYFFTARRAAVWAPRIKRDGRA